MNDRFKVQLFGGNQRKTILQVKTHLVTKYADGARAGTVMLLSAGFHYMAHKVKILLHISMID